MHRQASVACFSRNMAGQGVIERIRTQPYERCNRRRAHKAIQHDRNLLPARRQHGAQDGRELAATERSREHQRVLERYGMAGERLIDDGALARKAFVVEAGAAADPARAAAAQQASAVAAAAVVLPIPISPRQTSSASGTTAL